MENHHKDSGRIKRMGVALGANLISTGYSLYAALSGDNTVYNGEVKHSGADSGVYGSRIGAEISGADQNTAKFRMFLAFTMGVPAVFLGWDAVNAYHDIFVSSDVLQETSRSDYLGATVIITTNSAAYIAMRGVENHSHASRANLSHAIADLGASVSYGAGLIAEERGLIPGGSTYGTFIGSGLAGGHLGYEAVQQARDKGHKH